MHKCVCQPENSCVFYDITTGMDRCYVCGGEAKKDSTPKEKQPIQQKQAAAATAAA